MSRLIKQYLIILGVASQIHLVDAADDLYEILELALINDPVLRGAEASYRANKETVNQSRALFRPSVGIGGTSSRLTSGPSDPVYRGVVDPVSGKQINVRVSEAHSFRPGINNHGWGVNINQSLVNVSNWYNLASAKANDRAAALNLVAQEQDLIMRVSMSYFNVLRAEELLSVNIQEEQAAQRSLEQTQQREEVGLVAITDVLDAQAAYDLARNTTILQQNQVQSSYEALEAITGLSHPAIEVLDVEFPIQSVDGDLRDWEKQAEENNLAIASAEYSLEASLKAVKARKSDRLPTLDLVGSFGHNVTAPIVSQGIQIGGGAFDRSSVAVSVSVPLYTGNSYSSRMRAAEFNAIAAQENLTGTKRQLKQNIRNSYRKVNTDVLVIAQRQRSIDSAQSALEATELGAEVGTRNIVEVLRARENLYRALRQYAEARFDYVIDTLLLKQTSGVLSPQDIIELNEWLGN